MEGKRQNQIKSKKRVYDFGEVYTNEKEVDAMLDLVKIESNRIDSNFLEPACGNGNFLIKILERKMKTVKKKYKKVQFDYERYLFIAVSSIYGIDIQSDNIRECIDRLYFYIEKEYKKLYKEEIDEGFLKSIKYVLSTNLICGDTLTGIMSNGEPILFAEWSLIGNDVKRKDFVMCEMVAYSELEDKNTTILEAQREFPKINYKEVYMLG